MSGFHVPNFAISPNDMEVLASYYAYGGDVSMLSYLAILDDMAKTPFHLEANWRKAAPSGCATTSATASSTLLKLEKLEKLRSELCMLQQKKMAIIAGLALQAKQGIVAHHADIGKPAGSLAWTNTAGKRRDEVRKGYKEGLALLNAQAGNAGGEELTLVSVAQRMDLIALQQVESGAPPSLATAPHAPPGRL